MASLVAIPAIPGIADVPTIAGVPAIAAIPAITTWFIFVAHKRHSSNSKQCFLYFLTHVFHVSNYQCH
jgi:hypothetical protein